LNLTKSFNKINWQAVYYDPQMGKYGAETNKTGGTESHKRKTLIEKV